MWMILPAAIFLVGTGLLVVRLRRSRRRRQLLASTLSAQDWDLIEFMVPLVLRLPTDLQLRLQGKIALFLDQVAIYGRGDVVADRPVKLSVAAQACLLIVNRDVWYETLHTVLLYPGAFRSKQQSRDGFVVTEQDQVRLGESWQHGPVVLSWPHADQGGRNPLDGQNLVLHEFAHQLDALSGQTNGVPILMRGQTFEAWERAILEGYEAHAEKVRRNKKSVLSDYAATNYVEFLAVSVEVFFEKPERLFDEYPDVYDQLSIMLNLDPRDWG